MRARLVAIGSGVLLLLCGGSTLAEEPATPLYTNDDLEQLEPRDRRPETPVETEPADWDFVNDFIERAHERIDAERERELARAALQAHTVERRRGGFGYTLCPAALGYPYSTHRHRDRRSATGNPTRTATIRPVHAGPSKAMRMRAQASRNSGSDAFPRHGR